MDRPGVVYVDGSGGGCGDELRGGLGPLGLSARAMMTFIYFQVLCSYGQIRRGLLLNNLTDRFAMSAENIICIVPLCRSPPDWPERSERCVDGAVEHRGQRCRRRGRRRGRQQRRCRAHSTSWFPRHTCVHARYSRSLDLKVTPCAVLLGSMMCLLCEYPSLLVAECT